MQTNNLVQRPVYEDVQVHDRTIPTHRELIERDRDRMTDQIIQLVLKSDSASQAILAGEEK